MDDVGSESDDETTKKKSSKSVRAKKKQEVHRKKKQKKEPLIFAKPSEEEILRYRETLKKKPKRKSNKESSDSRLKRTTVEKLGPFVGQNIKIDPRRVDEPDELVASRGKRPEQVKKIKDFYLTTNVIPPQKSLILAFPNVSCIFHLLDRFVARGLLYLI